MLINLLSLVLQSRCNFFSPSGTLWALSDWAYNVYWLKSFTVLGTKYQSGFLFLINVGIGIHCLRIFSFFFLEGEGKKPRQRRVRRKQYIAIASPGILTEPKKENVDV